MLKQWFPVTGVGALVLLLSSAGVSRAQFFFPIPIPIPIGPVGAMSPWSGAGGWGYYPGAFGVSALSPSYRTMYANYSYPSTFNMGTYPNYSSYSHGGIMPSYFGTPALYGMPSSVATMPVSYVAYYPPLFSSRAPTVAPAAGLLPADQPATVEVMVPADTVLVFDGQTTSQTGVRRVFTTPELEKGKSYHYRVEAKFMQDGKSVTQTQRVQVYAGANVTIVFPMPKPR
jgi:uncharacterized protein (TIGR03000 family)